MILNSLGLSVEGLIRQENDESLLKACKTKVRDVLLESFDANWPQMIHIEDVLERSRSSYVTGSIKRHFFRSKSTGELYLVIRAERRWGLCPISRLL